MKALKVCTFALFSGLLSQPAAMAWDSTIDTTISKVTSTYDGGFYIETPANLCTSTDDGRARKVASISAQTKINGKSASELGVSSLLSLSLTALAANKPVRVYVNNGGWACVLGAIKIHK
ncbi:hypothetical protein [Pseudoalteromonas rubra]|uniref:Uncharacterized protein n=1 Tax=Pseudoalteromonas rubra TaxID=43658 RepID=A0A0U3GD23_9GAMM|nr:hypothetical protein [Pseudoalteromonas rubra]ALU42698.1 hypothetical protein AT705_06835 [Pseudoalteromonas rubra]